jgi:hypothetical protein
MNIERSQLHLLLAVSREAFPCRALGLALFRHSTMPGAVEEAEGSVLVILIFAQCVLV